MYLIANKVYANLTAKIQVTLSHNSNMLLHNQNNMTLTELLELRGILQKSGKSFQNVILYMFYLHRKGVAYVNSPLHYRLCYYDHTTH